MLAALRRRLPETFLNVRLSPVEIIHQSVEEIRQAVIDRVTASDNPWLTGVCCINMDDRVTDDKVRAIFEAVFELPETGRGFGLAVRRILTLAVRRHVARRRERIRASMSAGSGTSGPWPGT